MNIGLGNLGSGNMAWWGFGGIMIALMILFWAAVIYAIIWLIRGGRSGSHAGDQAYYSRSALDILKERYAKGEINKEEFEAKKKDLGG